MLLFAVHDRQQLDRNRSESNDWHPPKEEAESPTFTSTIDRLGNDTQVFNPPPPLPVKRHHFLAKSTTTLCYSRRTMHLQQDNLSLKGLQGGKSLD